MEIVLYPDPMLRKPAKRVEKFDEDLRRFAREMLEAMYRAKGVGLSAPQVADGRRVLVLNPTGDPKEARLEQVLVNPRILKRRGDVAGEEGCLSFPKIYAEIARAETIVVEAADVEGKVSRFEASGFLGRIIQHEADHLDGVLFIDRMSPADRIRVKPLLQNLEEGAKKGKTRLRPDEAEPEPVPGIGPGGVRAL